MKKILIATAGLLFLIFSAWYIPLIINDTIEPQIIGQRYVVALGDSVASGAGLGTGRQNPGCDLSDAAFPLVLGADLHQPVLQFACSGATVAPTSDKVTNGLVEQFQAAKKYVMDSDVVVTAGANDTGWLQLIVSCATESCATEQNSRALESTLPALQQNLATLLSQIQTAQPHALIVNTYYDLLNSGDSCFERLGITPAESAFIHDEAAKLNAAIASAAHESRATIVKVDFGGHLLCDATPWIQDATAKAPLHPTAAGQRRIAAQDAQAIKAMSALPKTTL